MLTKIGLISRGNLDLKGVGSFGQLGHFCGHCAECESPKWQANRSATSACKKTARLASKQATRVRFPLPALQPPQRFDERFTSQASASFAESVTPK